MARGFGTMGQQSNSESWAKKYPFFDLRAKENQNQWFSLRPVGIPGSHQLHWVTFTTKEGQRKTFPMECCRWNPETETCDPSRPCAACDAQAMVNDKNIISSTTEWFANFIIRKIQGEVPANAQPGQSLHIDSHPEELASQYRELTHVSWTPIRLVRMTPALVYQLRQIAPLNQRRNADGNIEVYDMSDPLNGCDIFVRYDPSAAPAQKYQVNKGEPNSLTAEELKYKLWNVDALVEYNNMENQASLQRLHFLGGGAPAQIQAAANSGTMQFDLPMNGGNVPPAANQDVPAASATPTAQAVPSAPQAPQQDFSSIVNGVSPQNGVFGNDGQPNWGNVNPANTGSVPPPLTQPSENNVF